MNETVLALGSGRARVGILTEATVSAQTGVVLLNAGLIHRVGPSRVYVRIARRLASEGHTTLRFDFGGVGDSGPGDEHLAYEARVLAEARQALDTLEIENGIHEFIVGGHCSGAANAFHLAAADPRVVGVVLINLEGGSNEWADYDREKKQSRFYGAYFRDRLRDPASWRRLLSGRANPVNIVRTFWGSQVRDRLRSLLFRRRQGPVASPASVPPAMAQARAEMDRLIARGVKVLFVHSEGGTGLEFVRATLGAHLDRAIKTGAARLDILPQSDHIFTVRRSQEQLTDAISVWVNAHFRPEAGPDAIPLSERSR